ncbi:SRPBCC family protein [Cytophaga aurantiaca]|uniref:SRPBCC family protein n=1 Tax=Cytophaga aurantiaca TaxID=29530 RepID=UPI00037FAC83|nr:SRPBCC family protein [Cytophaga aurantiaca]
MKILKKILIGLAAFIALLLIIALFIPKDYTVSVSTTINKPQKEVYEYVKLIKNQENYSVWVMEDTNIVMTYTGIDGTVGFLAQWKSEQMGEGEQQITKVDGERVDVALRFKGHGDEQKAATIVKAINENQTQVTNEFYGHTGYPFNIMCFVGKMFITDAQTKNMANLKAILEK